MIARLERLPGNPLVTPAQVRYVRASGTFNPGAAVDHASGRVVLLVRVFDAETRRSTLALALSQDGRTVDEVWDRPAVDCAAPYEEWGVEDARVTWLVDEGRYAITYTGYSPAGPRVCLITTDDLLAPERYHRHGPRLTGDNKNCVVFPERVDGSYVILHRPMPRVECVRVGNLEDDWPSSGTTLLGPRPATWRSSRVGAGAPPIRTDVGWLFPFHGATTIDEGNVHTRSNEARYRRSTRQISKMAFAWCFRRDSLNAATMSSCTTARRTCPSPARASASARSSSL